MTESWLQQAELVDRKTKGQYMTPGPVRDALIDRLDLFEGMSVLDPGVGTGEFLASVGRREPSARIFGWDVDPGILEFAAQNAPGAELENRSALDQFSGETFDLVIGNPPYFQFRASPSERKRFAPVISGRPNIFALFFQVAFEAVKPGGQVAFVVPPSMNNGAYFEALRNFIVDHGRIEHLEVLEGSDLFEGANTAAQLIVIRAGESGSDFHMNRSCPEAGFERTIFSPNPGLIEREFNGRSTLWDLGYEAVTGTVVWNKHRSDLRKRAGSETVPLIWAHNLNGGALNLEAVQSRPQFIRNVKALQGPALLVNRVVGAVGKGSLKSALVPEGMHFVAENHVNVIRSRQDAQTTINWADLQSALSVDDIATRVRQITGNTQISGKELTHLIPLDT